MKLPIGKNIKQLRVSEGLTQRGTDGVICIGESNQYGFRWQIAAILLSVI